MAVKNVVFCFDVGGDTSATALFNSFDDSDQQALWYHDEPWSPPRNGWLQSARDAVRDAYDFLVQAWEPGDRIFVFGAGRGGYTAQSFTRLLGTVGVLPTMWGELLDFVVDSYGLPRTFRTDQDWDLVRQLIVDLNDGADPAIPVEYLGLWDAIRPSELAPQPDTAFPHLAAGRHAVAIDGGPLRRRAAPAPCFDVDEVWFRGGHCDVVGGPTACGPLVGIAADWMLEGALAAGVRVRDETVRAPHSPTQADALAGSARGLARRKMPMDAGVHASVELYLRAHPEYWRRLPARVVWVDREWLARGERLVAQVAIPADVGHQELAAAAS